MKRMVRRIGLVALAALLLLGMFSGCGSSKPRVVIYSTSEDYRNDMALSMLQEQFPDYNIVLEYVSTGTLASRLMAEGTSTECDIILELETTYMESLSDSLAVLDGEDMTGLNIDFARYEEGLVPENHRYVPWYRLSGAVVVNTALLTEKGLPTPTSYQDLLDERYQGLISMPSPSASSTGYIFLLSLVNAWGESEALDYFRSLADNVLQFTSSGSGPVKALLQGEAAIGLGITYQAVEAINAGNSSLGMLYFEEGAPYCTGSSAIIEGKQSKEGVQEVFDYIVNTVTPKDKELYAPEKIYKEQSNTVANYPDPIAYADMTGLEDAELKERLLEQWVF